jgi:cytochrome P450 family 135
MGAAATVAKPPIPAAGPSVPFVPEPVMEPGRAAALGLEYWISPGRFIDRCTEMGDRFTLHFPGAGKVVALSNPADIRTLYTAGPEATSVASIVKRFLPHHVIFGEENLAGYDGKRHLKERRLISPAFHGEALKSYRRAMVGVSERALPTWRYGEEISFRAAIAPVALDIIMEVVFGISDPERLARVRAHTLGYLATMRSRRFLAQTVWATARGGKWDGNYDYLLRARYRIEDVIREEIAQRRRHGDEQRRDILATFLATRYEDGSPMTEQQIMDSMVGLLVAGFETTGTTLAWLASEITRKPRVIARLEQSVADGDDRYIDATITETLRLRPPAIVSFRYLERDLELDDGMVLGSGTIAMAMIAAVHRRPDIYPDPLEFVPERFLEESPGTYSWLPFGGGARRCLGGSFAMVEMREIMRTVLQNARFRPVHTRPEGFGRSNVLLSPSRGARLTLELIS